MKVLKLLSAILALLLVFLLGFGNIIYKQLRTWIDKEYIYINVDDDLLDDMYLQAHPDFYFSVFSEEDSYSPYERILIYSRIATKSDMSIPQSAVIEVKFYDDDGNVLRDINNSTELKLVYNPFQEVWTGYWYPADTTVRGNITLKAYGYPDTPQGTLETENNFYISEMPAEFELENGKCFLGIDSTERVALRTLLTPDNEIGGWNSIPEWVEFLSADGVLMLAGLTETFDEDVTLDSPWNKDKISESLTLAERIDGDYGAWIKALELEGSELDEIGYEASLYLSEGSYREANSIVSLKDESRKTQISKLFNQLMNDNSVSYVGLSEIFHDNDYDIEFLEEFVKEFQLSVPDGWQDMDFDEKFEVFAVKFENDDFLNRFNLWKNYMVSDYFKSIIDDSGHSKPVFYYCDYEDLENNSELLTILFNSGVDFVVLNFAMDYLNLESDLDEMKENTVVDTYFDRIIFSYKIDYENVNVNEFGHSAIENYVQGNLQLARYGSDNKSVKGLMINDLYEAMFGRRGPYVSYEWILGLGKSIYEYKKMATGYPVLMDSYLDSRPNDDGSFTASFRLANVSSEDIENLKIHFLPVQDSEDYDTFIESLGTLAAGSETNVEYLLHIDIQGAQFVRKKYFVGIQVEWDDINSDMFSDTEFVDFMPVSVENVYMSTNLAMETLTNATNSITNE